MIFPLWLKIFSMILLVLLFVFLDLYFGHGQKVYLKYEEETK